MAPHAPIPIGARLGHRVPLSLGMKTFRSKAPVHFLSIARIPFLSAPLATFLEGQCRLLARHIGVGWPLSFLPVGLKLAVFYLQGVYIIRKAQKFLI